MRGYDLQRSCDLKYKHNGQAATADKVLSTVPTPGLLKSLNCQRKEIVMNKRQKLSILQLEDLPNEILLKIFKKLDVKDLLRCGQMSKRIRAISMDESLWEKINLMFKKVPIGFLGLVLRNGCKYLSLFGAKLIGETEDFTQFWKNCRELKVRKI